MLLRDILAPEYRNLPPEQLGQIFETTLGVSQEDLEDAENFWQTLQGVGRTVGNALPTILPVAGTVVGTAFGGPLGATLGGALGSAAGRAVGGALGQPPSAPAMQQPTPPMQQPPRMVPPTPTQMPGGSPAAAQLMQTMFRPETLQALLAMLAGQAGRRTIPVGNTQVPTGAFTNLLSVLANQAAAEYNAAAPAFGEIPSYLQDFAGEVIGDPAVAEHRAAALWELLQEAPLKDYASGSYGLEYRDDERELDERELDERELHERELDDQFYDAMDLAELDEIYES